MKLTEKILKSLIREAISIGDTTTGDLPPEVNKLSDFILSITDDPSSDPDSHVQLANQAQLKQAQMLAEVLMEKYSDLLQQLKFNMRAKIRRKYGDSFFKQGMSREYRNFVQFFELFEEQMF